MLTLSPLATTLPVAHLVLRATIIYVAVLFLLRIAGKRQIGHMGTGEFVSLLLISDAVQNAMTGGDNSLGAGLVLAAVIIVLSAGAAYLSYRSKRWESLLQGRPALLIHNGEVVHKNLEHEMLNVYELKTLLRRQGLHDLREIHQAVLESDGSISVVRKSEASAAGPA